MYGLSWEEQGAFPDRVDTEGLLVALKEAFVSCFGTNEYDKATCLDRVSVASLLSTVVESCLGKWSSGWNGDLVGVWCCPNHSVFARVDRKVDDTLDRVVSAVETWHSILCEAKELFEKLAEDSKGQSIEAKVEYATGPLVDFVVRRNNAEDAWFYAVIDILSWYLESIGVETRMAASLIEEIVEGHFESWVSPSPEQIQAVATALGSAVSTRNEDVQHVDTTALWMARRGFAWAQQPIRPAREIGVDQHANFIHEFDFQRSTERGEAMKLALAQCRADARGKQSLDWEMLCRWQAIVLRLGGDQSIKFRVGDAFAKQGRDYYPIKPSTPKEFKRNLIECNNTDECVLIRATRLFGDICFYHPFENGNARSARLAVEFLLARNGLAMQLPRALFTFPRTPKNIYHFLGTLRSVIGKRKF